MDSDPSPGPSDLVSARRCTTSLAGIDCTRQALKKRCSTLPHLQIAKPLDQDSHVISKAAVRGVTDVCCGLKRLTILSRGHATCSEALSSSQRSPISQLSKLCRLGASKAVPKIHKRQWPSTAFEQRLGSSESSIWELPQSLPGSRHSSTCPRPSELSAAPKGPRHPAEQLSTQHQGGQCWRAGSGTSSPDQSPVLSRTKEPLFV